PDRLIEFAPPSVNAPAVEAIVIPAKLVPAAKSSVFVVWVVPSKVSESPGCGGFPPTQLFPSVQLAEVPEPPFHVIGDADARMPATPRLAANTNALIESLRLMNREVSAIAFSPNKKPIRNPSHQPPDRSVHQRTGLFFLEFSEKSPQKKMRFSRPSPRATLTKCYE
ncbi:MAG TPA: hypothetical protein VHS31_18880, partial [Tepidisphaeraceae bacterium]|nr:hypothetical protein [Tepidisphaeraceae bacterium]